MKPLKVKNYGRIPHLSNSKLGISDSRIDWGQEKILTDKKSNKHEEIFAFEKYDGSNVGICKINNQIIGLTKGGYMAKSSSFVQHKIFSDWVLKTEGRWHSLLNEGERLVGEWLLIAHGLKYRINTEPLVIFDHFTTNNKRSSFNFLSDLSHRYEFNTPRLLHRGDAISVNKLLPILNKRTNAISSYKKPEGIVYRSEVNGEVKFLGKWVRSDFVQGEYIIGKKESELFWNMPIEKLYK